MALPFQMLAAQSGRILQVKGKGLKSCLVFDFQWGLAIHNESHRGVEKNTTLYVLWSSQETWDCSFHHKHANPQARWCCCHQGDEYCEKRTSLEWEKRGACTVVSKLAEGRIPATEQISTKFWTITRTQRNRKPFTSAFLILSIMRTVCFCHCREIRSHIAQTGLKTLQVVACGLELRILPSIGFTNANHTAFGSRFCCL